jgi:DNA repair protein RecO (recombination protein O)
MTLVTTRAIVLAAVQYGDTSKIVKLATRDLGVQSAIAKGALRPKSRFGAALQLFSEGPADLYLKDTRELQTLGAFDAQRVRLGLTADVARWAAAAAAAELMLRFAQPDPQPDVFDMLRTGLDALESAPAERVDATGLRLLWQLIAVFGFAPTLEVCARDGRVLPEEGPLAFSALEGGALCTACARGRAVVTLEPPHRMALAALLDPWADLPSLEAKAAAAHRRLYARYVRAHLTDGAPLPAHDFWLGRSWEGRPGTDPVS